MYLAARLLPGCSNSKYKSILSLWMLGGSLVGLISNLSRNWSHAELLLSPDLIDMQEFIDLLVHTGRPGDESPLVMVACGDRPHAAPAAASETARLLTAGGTATATASDASVAGPFAGGATATIMMLPEEADDACFRIADSLRALMPRMRAWMAIAAPSRASVTAEPPSCA